MLSNLRITDFCFARNFFKSYFNLKNVIVSLLFLSSFWYVAIAHRADMDNQYSTDEYHSFIMTSKLFFKPIEDSRVFGGIRWFTRLTYPLSVYYVSKRMGGEHYITGWKYPGHFYLKDKDLEAVKSDPIMQDFVYSQRMIFACFVIASILFLVNRLWAEISPFSGIFYFSLLLSTDLFVKNIFEVYSDMFMFSLFNIVVGLLISKKITKSIYLLIIILSLLIISTKLNGILVAAPIFLLAYFIRDKIVPRCTIKEILFISFLSLLFFNFFELLNAENFFAYTFSNVYHYYTGHYDTIAGGLPYVILAVSGFFPLFILFVLSVFLYVARYKKISFSPVLYILIFIIIAMIASIFGLRIHVMRNYLQACGAMAIFSAIVLPQTLLFNNKVNKFFAVIVGCAISVVVVYLGLKNNSLIRTNFLSNLSGNIAVIEPAQSIVAGKHTLIKEMPREFTLITQLEEFKNIISGFDSVLVYVNQNNKQYSHYILPKLYAYKARYGDYILFVRR